MSDRPLSERVRDAAQHTIGPLRIGEWANQIAALEQERNELQNARDGWYKTTVANRAEVLRLTQERDGLLEVIGLAVYHLDGREVWAGNVLRAALEGGKDEEETG